MPLSKINPRPIPDVEHLSALHRALAQGIKGEALEAPHVVFLACRELVAEGEVTGAAAAQIARVEVSDGPFDAFEVSRIVAGMGVKVAITSVDVEAVQSSGGSQWVGQDRCGLLAEAGIELSAQRELASALEGLEEMGSGGTMIWQEDRAGLEEAAPRSDRLKAPGNAASHLGEVVEFGTVTLEIALGESRAKGGEELISDRGVRELGEMARSRSHSHPKK